MYQKIPAVITIFILVLFMSCTSIKKTTTPVVTPVVNKPLAVENKEDIFFIELFKKFPGVMDSMLAHRNDWNVQIIYTEINRNRNGIPALTHHYFNRQNARYFYPASSVKLPVALLALEKLQELKIKGLDKSATMITEAGYEGQSPVYNDPNTADGKPSIAQYIKKIFLVSDNDAYNRLYEFLGQEYINAALHKKGFVNAQLLHRLNIFLTEDENRYTNPVKFYDSNNHLLYTKPLAYNRQAYPKRNDKMGRAYYRNGKLVNEPMDFSGKNRMELADLHQVLVSLVFPETVSAAQRFNITEEDRRFVLQYMSQFPSESVYPAYDSSYHNAFAKYLLLGAGKETMPKNIRIFNKIGNAYGQMVDVAYVADFEKNIEFMLSAAIYCNQDNILNDEKYDYNTIGFPFMKRLGKILYEYELKRNKPFPANLSSFIFNYNK